ncbi:hypothetical protein ES332_D02G111300v1 [Gossypium tomentosum]|uniref:Branched-chain-amino-acid transaminase n=1 Tax=Gossypium tomentosum TaxID=34277 RepID=A0A5D2LVP9_GOSTO|nr:hypothetical protein ES332_D02G111300v1 [Gossypium tomentosum]
MRFKSLSFQRRLQTSFNSKDKTYRYFSSNPAFALQQPRKASYNEDENGEMEWEKLGFGPVSTDFMYSMKCCEDGNLTHYGNIQFSPFAAVLNYGQGIIEGLKVNRKEDGRLLLFRPDQHALRMKMGAQRMCMPSPSIHQFIHAVKQTALANIRWVPPPGKGSLYIRPLLIGSGPVLGVGPAPEYMFLTYASLLYVEEEEVRAFSGGVGGVKSVSNDWPVLKALVRAKSLGFSDVLYLDSVNKKYLGEVSAANIITLKGNVISTPPTSGTILPGITRKSIIEIARGLGFQVEERSISVHELTEADEVFCTGTAVGVAAVGSVTYRGTRFEFKVGENTVCQALGSTLVGIQTGLIEDKKEWIFNIH